MEPILKNAKKLDFCTHYMVKMELIHFFSFPTSIAVFSLDLAFVILKVLTNDKRSGLTVVSFDRSPVNLFSL